MSNFLTITVTSSGVAVVAPSDCSAVRVQQQQGSDPPSTPYSVYSDSGLTNKIADVAAGTNYAFLPSGAPGMSAFANGQIVGYLKVASGTFAFTVGVVPAILGQGLGVNSLQLEGPQQDVIAQSISADGAITAKSGTVLITKTTALAGTLAAPTPGVDDGKILAIIDDSNHAHVVTVASGFNNSPSTANTATYGGTAVGGGSMVLEAYNGTWLTRSLTGVTLSHV